MLELIAGGISLINATATLIRNSYDVITSISLKRKGQDFDSRMKELEKHVFDKPVQEVYDPSIEKQLLYNDKEFVAHSLQDAQRIIAVDMAISNPIQTPEKFRSRISDNPEYILDGLTKLEYWNDQMRYVKDSTFIPVVFPKDGEQYLGWIKKGFAIDYFSYQPTDVATTLSPFIIHLYEVLKNQILDKDYYYSKIPTQILSKVTNARVPQTERIISVVDRPSVMNNSKCIVFTQRAMYYHNSFSYGHIPYKEFPNRQFKIASSEISLGNNQHIDITFSKYPPETILRLLDQIKEIAKQSL